MDKVQDRASLHESAVQRIARGEHEELRPRRRRGKNINSRVYSERLDDRIVEYLREHDVKVSQVQVLGTDSVIVWNYGAPWEGHGR